MAKKVEHIPPFQFSFASIKKKSLGENLSQVVKMKKKKICHLFPPLLGLNTHGGIRGELGREVGDRK